MGLFKGMKHARPTAGGNYLKPGDYPALEIQRITTVDSQNPEAQGSSFYVVELLVLAEPKKTDAEIDPNPVGSKPSWLVQLPGKFPDLAMGNIKNFLLAAYGSMADLEGNDRPEMDDIDEGLADASCDDDGPLVGYVVACNAFNKKTKRDTNFTRVNWSPPQPEWLRAGSAGDGNGEAPEAA